jgi:1-piperideine-2-carboxylate/1-pyrroline-2-carboxylate reductase [NAD(P)H]
MDCTSADRTEGLLPYRLLLAALERVMQAMRRNETTCPVRQRLALGPYGGVLLVMCATDMARAVCKTVTVHPSNAALPAVQATVEVLDAATGARLLRLNGDVLTARRTAALSALAVHRCILRQSLRGAPGAGPVKALIFGAGEQAKAHAAALSDLFAAENMVLSVKMVSRTRKDVQGWAAFAGAVTAEDVAEALVLVSATSSHVPIVTEDVAALIRRDAIVCAVGSFQATTSEWPPEFVRRCSVVVDHREACEAEAGDLIAAGLRAVSSNDATELSEVVGGCDWQPRGRTVFFKSVGTALWDLAAGNCAVERMNDEHNNLE